LNYFCTKETIEIIKKRIDYVPESKHKGLSDYIDFLIYQDADHFELSEEMIKELQERSKTPIEEYLSARETIQELKSKYLV
jgi:hypothetical protein